nr:beta-galactosidase [Photobacterium leiognathi]
MEETWNADRGFIDFFSPQTDSEVDRYYPKTTSVAYRWNWAQIEPNEGVYDFTIIENAIEQAKQAGKKISFRIMAQGYDNDWGTQSDLPSWLTNQIGKFKIDSVGNHWVADYSDITFQQKYSDLFRALAQRFDGSEDIIHIDVGAVGMHGSWSFNSNPLTNYKDLFNDFNNIKQIPVIAKSHFKKTPIITSLETGAEQFLLSGISAGTGWRADCLGGIYGSKDIVNDVYKPLIANLNNTTPEFSQAWRKAPVVMQVCGGFPYWKTSGITTEDAKAYFDFALKHHVSSIMFTGNEVPEIYRDIVKSASTHMGYRIELLSASILDNIPSMQSDYTIDTTWANTGSAPYYKSARLSFRIKDVNGNLITGKSTSLDANEIQPAEIYEAGTIEYRNNTTLQLRNLEPDSEYKLEAAFIKIDGSPAFTISSDLENNDNWMTISKFKTKSNKYKTIGFVWHLGQSLFFSDFIILKHVICITKFNIFLLVT